MGIELAEGVIFLVWCGLTGMLLGVLKRRLVMGFLGLFLLVGLFCIMFGLLMESATNIRGVDARVWGLGTYTLAYLSVLAFLRTERISTEERQRQLDLGEAIFDAYARLRERDIRGARRHVAQGLRLNPKDEVLQRLRERIDLYEAAHEQQAAENPEAIAGRVRIPWSVRLRMAFRGKPNR